MCPLMEVPAIIVSAKLQYLKVTMSKNLVTLIPESLKYHFSHTEWPELSTSDVCD